MGRNSFLAGVIFLALVYLFVLNFNFSAQGQSETVFTPTTKFDIPVNNSSISFARNGTYEQASLENGVWNFVNLRFNTSASLVNSPFNNLTSRKLETLKVSAEDSVVNIISCLIYNGTFAGERTKGASLRYSVVGKGTQIFDLGLDPEKGDWDAIIDGEWVGESQGLSVSPNGALTVNGATRNVILFYWGFPGSFGEDTTGFDQPFLNLHSVIIATTFVVVTIVASAVVVQVRRKELN